jgi:hypothetical protein
LGSTLIRNIYLAVIGSYSIHQKEFKASFAYFRPIEASEYSQIISFG